MKSLWKGNINFGLISIQVSLYSAYKGIDLHFKLLDSRDKSKIRYEKVNEHTGEEMPWEKIIKTYQINNNQYIPVKHEQFFPKNSTNIDIEMFTNLNEISPSLLAKESEAKASSPRKLTIFSRTK